MDKLIKSKSLEKVDFDKLVEDFNSDDFANRESDEIRVFITNLRKESEALAIKKEDTIRDSGVGVIDNQIKRLDSMAKECLDILSSRLTAEDVGDNVLVQLTADNDVTVTDEDGQHTETVEVPDKTVQFDLKITYYIPTLAEYNSASGENLTEESYLWKILEVFMNPAIGLSNVVSYAHVYLDKLEPSVATAILEKNLEWHLLCQAISINSTKLNTAVSRDSQLRETLRGFNLLFQRGTEKDVKPRSSLIQGSLFDDDFVEVNLLNEGE